MYQEDIVPGDRPCTEPRPRHPTIRRAAKGETVEPNVDTGTEMVTKENAAKFQ